MNKKNAEVELKLPVIPDIQKLLPVIRPAQHI